MNSADAKPEKWPWASSPWVVSVLLSFIAALFYSDRTALAMGLFVSGINLGLVAGGTLAGGIGETYGWRSAILALGFTGLPVLGISYALLKGKLYHTEQVLSPDSHVTPIWSSLGEVMKIPSFWVLTLGGIFLNFGSWIFLNWLPVYFQETYRMGLAASGFSANAYTTLGAVLGMMVGGYLSDWATKHGLHHRLLQEALWIGVCLPFPLFFVFPNHLFLIFLSIFAFTLFRSMGAANSTPLYCEVLAMNTWSTAFGFVNMVNSIAAGAGVVLAGYFKQYFGLNLVFTAVPGVMLMAVIVLFVGYGTYIKADLERQGHVIPSGKTL